MNQTNNLKNIISRQKEVFFELEAELQAQEGMDYVQENIGLKEELAQLRSDNELLKDNASLLKNDNMQLRNALYEQIYNEKVKIINTTGQKLDVYFQMGKDEGLNRLTVIENDVRTRIDNYKAILAKNQVELHDEIYARLDEVSVLLNKRITDARANASQLPGTFSQEEIDKLIALRDEQVTEEQMHTIVKKNNIERFIGLNVLNAIGIFLLIVGAITFARLTYVQLSEMLKGIMLFVLGGFMLTAGEVLNRKKPNIFSLGISAGGIGILYAALATSYFILQILGMYPAILICVLITAVAFLLSIRYNSQTIIAFALIGGYLPLFSIGAVDVILYGAMVYFIVLNLLALLISLNKKWRIASYIGLFLNIMSTIYICAQSYWTEEILKQVCTILYALFAFLIYTAIPIVSTYRTKQIFRKADVVLLAINTFSSSIIMYGVFYGFGWEDFNGLLAVAFALIYILMGKVIEKKFAGAERGMEALFYLTGLAFVVLVVPLQFGKVWWSLGWLAEGVLLATYGVIKNEKWFKKIGGIIGLMCMGAFILFDVSHLEDSLFVFKYLAITIGSMIVLGAYMYKKMMVSWFVRIYKYLVLLNTWLFMMYLILVKIWFMLQRPFSEQSIYYRSYYLLGLAVIVTFVLAYTFSRIKLLFDGGTKAISITLYIMGLFSMTLLNVLLSPVFHEYFQVNSPSFTVTIVGTITILISVLFSVAALRDLLKMIVLERKLSMEWYPIILSGYFVFTLTLILVRQYQFAFSNATLSIIYVLTALIWTIFGFKRRYSLIRQFGLVLAILSVIKLFIIDLAKLTEGIRIVAYFALGVTLIAISFVYQYFNKRLELKEEANKDVEKLN